MPAATGAAVSREFQRLLTPADGVLVATVLLAAAYLLMHPGQPDGPAAAAVVEVDGRLLGRYSLHALDTLLVQGALGPYRIGLGPQGACILQAPCRGQVCVHQGWVRRRGDVVVCLPGRVVVRLAGPADAADLDAVLR